MPQFNFATFPSQIFWLIICFAALYFLLARTALPKIGAVLEARQRKIDDDLERATELELQAKEALAWTMVWITLSLIFNAFVWWRFGREPALEFLSAYVIEKSLSVDNIFVFVVIFRYMNCLLYTSPSPRDS